MSLLKKASIITTPTAYAEDYLYSIKPAYALGSELITQFDGVADGTDVATLAGWSAYNTATSKNVVDEKLVIVTSSYNQGALFTATTTIGTKYLFKATATGDLGLGGMYLTSGSLNSNIDTSNGNVEIRFTALSTATYLFFRASNNNAGTTTYADISLKPITDADFDFDRNSTGTRVNEDYLIEDVPYNLLVQSNQFDTTWFNSNSTDTSGQAGYNYSNDAWKIDITGAAGYISQSLTQSGLQTVSVFVKAGTLNFVRCRVTGTGGNKFVDVNLTNGAIGTTGAENINATSTNIGEGWYRITLTYNATTSAFLIYPIQADSDFTATSGNIFIQYAQLVKGDQPKDYLKTTDRLDIPRIDYTNGEPSILLEPSRTNLVTYSQDLTQGWGGYTFSGGSISVTYGFLSPEGLNNASRITYTNSSAGSGGSLWTTNITLVASTQYTISFYAKRVSGTKQIRVDLRNSSSSGVSGSVFTLTDKWERYSTTVTNDSATSRGVQIRIIDSEYSGNRTFDIYGFQLEAGSYETSLIHTSGSAVTRSADSANNAGNSDLINSTEGVLYAEIAALADDQTGRFFAISDGSSSNRIRLGFQSGVSNRFRALVVSGGSTTVDMNDTNTTLSDITEYNKVAFKFKQNDFALYFNGREVKTDTSGNTPTGLNLVAFDNAATNIGGFFYGNCKMVAVFKEALTDLELEKLTGYNNHELYMNYYNRLSYLGLAEEYNVESDINNYIL